MICSGGLAAAGNLPSNPKMRRSQIAATELKVNDAVSKYQKLLEQYPDNELARFSLGKALYDASQFVPAKEQFEVALGKKPDWMAVRILLGKCELSLGNRAAAIVSFERARQLAIEQNHEGPREEMEQLLADMASPG